ncbi:MAG TPA: multiheme c-type cytochrome [Candidatus Acidoferrum sp.]|nr:multiheme c-type cytochrome [Candidatus Acidoferrum sp.]
MNRELHPQKLPRSRFRSFFRRVVIVLVSVLVPVAVLLAVSTHYERTHGGACASCHEIWQPYSDWHTSAHRNVPCTDCHGDVFTLNAGFHINNMRRVFTHLRGDAPAKPRLRTKDVFEMVPRCQKCHEQEFADWQSSAHSASYSDIFLNADHNKRQLLMDDCLRCHGMHFEGGIRDLVSPLTAAGPWQLKSAAFTAQPVIPCLTCHQMHHQGAPLGKSVQDQPIPGTQQEINRPSLALFDRRELEHVSVAELPLPEKMFDGTREVHISPDQRQALCYQCHAPISTRQVRSGDDRTPIGVHEGLSCLSCHATHGQQTRPSCSTCHPKLSNCNIPVETMDTTFKNRKSLHNIHFVKCLDCHTHGIPKKKATQAVTASVVP